MQVTSARPCRDGHLSDEDSLDVLELRPRDLVAAELQLLDPVGVVGEPRRARAMSGEASLVERRVRPHPAPSGGVAAPTAHGEPLALHERLAKGAQALAGQLRALHERYEEEHRRLADSLEFLAVQSRDLERGVAAFDQLARALGTNSAHIRRSSLIATGVQTSAPAVLEVRCLGTFEVRSDGCPLELGTSRNGRLIFKYLVARAPGRRASKEVLADLFWPETPAERALPSLHSALHQVRRAMGRSDPRLRERPAVVYADDSYGLNPRIELRLDVDDFRGHLAKARVQDAHGGLDGLVEAYRLAEQAYGGELLPEERYADWVVAERASLEADQASILTRLVELYMARGEYQQAVGRARRLLDLDPTREDIHRELIRCHSRLGQRTEGLRQFRRCFEAVQRELDVLPDPETSALFERLSRGDLI